MDYIHLALKDLRGGLNQERVAAIAIGNEPNFYGTNVTNYANQVQTLEKEIVTNLSLSEDQSKTFEVANVALKAEPSWL